MNKKNPKSNDNKINNVLFNDIKNLIMKHNKISNDSKDPILDKKCGDIC